MCKPNLQDWLDLALGSNVLELGWFHFYCSCGLQYNIIVVYVTTMKDFKPKKMARKIIICTTWAFT
jgi:hypothetical protein